MFDDNLFDHLTPRETAEVVLHGVFVPREAQKPVILEIKYCGRGSPYWNAMLKLKTLADPIEAAERAARLWVKHGVTGWRNVDIEGQPVAFAAERCAEILVKLVRATRADKVDDAIAWSMNADNFVAQLVDATDLGNG